MSAHQDDPEPVPAELAMLRQLLAMQPGAAIAWVTSATLVVSGCSTPERAYADWLARTERRVPA